MNKNRKLLLRSLEESLSADEAKELAQAKGRSAALRDEEAHLLRLRRLIGNTGKEAFCPDFTDKVLERIAREETRVSRERQAFQSLFAVFRPFAVASALFAVALCPFAWYAISEKRNENAIEEIVSIIDEAHLACLEEHL